ncbi:hypothetical protein ACVWWO_007297 [Bradyrhizobium sp. F1.13.1]
MKKRNISRLASGPASVVVALVWIATIHVIFRADRPYANYNSVIYAELSSVSGSGPPPRCTPGQVGLIVHMCMGLTVLMISLSSGVAANRPTTHS